MTQQALGLVSLVVRDYDEALAYYVGTLGFTLLEDTVIAAQRKRWVVVAPPGGRGAHILLARAGNDEQAACIGHQTGGRVFLFLYTDDFARDHAAYRARGVVFVGEPRHEPYGTVAVFEDLYGNRWDLIEPQPGHPARGMVTGHRSAGPFATQPLPAERTVAAPDGSDVRVLLRLAGGGMAHFSLLPGAVARAVMHRTVEELWFIVAGQGQMWRSQGGREETVALAPGVCLSIPLGTRFQFRAAADSALAAIAVTMPPWPGEGEAVFVPGPWTPTV